MPRFSLDQISKMPAAIQAQVMAQMGPKTALPVSSPAEPDKTPQEPLKTVRQANREADEARLAASLTMTKDGPVEPSALDLLPVYVPATLLRHILENWGSAFHACANETQRRKVVENCVQVLARREGNPNSIP